MAELLIDRTFIRVQDAPGTPWRAASIREASHRQFHDWATLWFLERLKRHIDVGPLESTPEEREQVLKLMVEQGIAPAMMKEGGQAQ